LLILNPNFAQINSSLKDSIRVIGKINNCKIELTKPNYEIDKINYNVSSDEPFLYIDKNGDYGFGVNFINKENYCITSVMMGFNWFAKGYTMHYRTTMTKPNSGITIDKIQYHLQIPIKQCIIEKIIKNIIIVEVDPFILSEEMLECINYKNRDSTLFNSKIKFEIEIELFLDSLERISNYEKKLLPGKPFVKPNDDKSNIVIENTLKEKISIENTIYKKHLLKKKKLNKQINKSNKRIDKLKNDIIYKNIDFTKYLKLQQFFNQINVDKLNISTQELNSLNILMDNYTKALKILSNKKKFKKYKLYDEKFKILTINIFELCNYILTYDRIGYLQNEDNEILYSSIDQEGFYNINDDLHINSCLDCNTGEGYPIKVTAINSNNTQVNGLTVKYNYAMEYKKCKPMEYGQLTSPACEKILPGIYMFWLIDSYKRNSLKSYPKEVNISGEFKPKNNEVKSVEIPVIQ